MRSETITFERVERWVQKSGKCACGINRTRKETLWATLNPFNVNAKGFPKTRVEVREDLERKASEWMKAPITCRKCEP